MGKIKVKRLCFSEKKKLASLKRFKKKYLEEEVPKNNGGACKRLKNYYGNMFDRCFIRAKKENLKELENLSKKQENNKNNFVVPKYELESDLSEKMKSYYKEIKSESISSKDKFIGLKRKHVQENLDNKINDIYLESIKGGIIPRNINKNNLPTGLLIDTNEIDSTNADNYIFNEGEILLEEYSKILGNEGVDKENLELEKRVFGKDVTFGSHFNKNKEKQIYAYDISKFGKNALIEMKCHNKSCKAIALYNYITKVFYLAKAHNIVYQKHKLKNTLMLNASDYKNYLRANKHITDIQIYKVQKEDLKNVNSLKCILREEELQQVYIKLRFNESENK